MQDHTKAAQYIEQVELAMEKDSMIIMPLKSIPRVGWDKAFRLMHERHDDVPLISDIDIEMEGWEWK